MKFCGRFNCNSLGCNTGSLRHVSIDAVIPVILIPILTIVASLSVTCTILVFSITPLIIFYAHQFFLRFINRTKFYLTWTVTTVLTLMTIFELCVVPLLEILPEENYVFMIGVVGGLFCGFRTRQSTDQLKNEESLIQGLELGDAKKETCTICRRQTPAKAYHCRLCQTCILGREYHCKWLDCCVGSNNLRWYIGCLFFSAFAFIYGSNLAMTTVCHPFLLVGTLLLPDDCSDVYYQLDIAVCFVASLYSLIIGIFLTLYLLYHFWLLYLGTTANERSSFKSKKEFDECPYKS